MSDFDTIGERGPELAHPNREANDADLLAFLERTAEKRATSPSLRSEPVIEERKTR